MHGIYVFYENLKNADHFSLALFAEISLSMSTSCPRGRGGGVLPYISYIGMCRPKGYGF